MGEEEGEDEAFNCRIYLFFERGGGAQSIWCRIKGEGGKRSLKEALARVVRVLEPYMSK